GPKCAVALLIGLALSGVQGSGFRVQEDSASTTTRHSPLITLLFSLAMGLALAQWTHQVLPFAEMSRAEKIHVLEWAVGALVVLILLSDYGGRYLDWRKRHLGESGQAQPGDGQARGPAPTSPRAGEGTIP